MLKFENVSKVFGKITALKSISFEVNDGEFVLITGPSGSGKTTLLRLIMREFVSDTGKILLDDIDITSIKKKDVPKLRQQMGVVFQDFKVLKNRTVRENIEVALAIIGLSQKEWKKRVDHVLELVDLENRQNLFPNQLSGGELQRVSLARALSVNPKIILADEPTGNLDWDTTVKLMELFTKINKEGKTILMATHHKQIIDKLGIRNIKLERDVNGKSDEPKSKEEPVKSESKEEKKNV